MKYGRRIPCAFRLIVRNGYAKWIDFDLVKEQFIGLRDFYQDFGLSSGHTLVFEYAGDFDMKVFICDMYGSEIEYPKILRNLQNSAPFDGMISPILTVIMFKIFGCHMCIITFLQFSFMTLVGPLCCLLVGVAK